MPTKYYILSFSEEDTDKIAYLLASLFLSTSTNNCSIYLYSSEVGLGKTSFCRGFLKGLGYVGHVRSPSYTLVESYVLDFLTVYHFDFYRLNTLEDLECIGVRDYFGCCSFRLVEWPNLLVDNFPKEDISINLEYYQLSVIRKITLGAVTFLGELILNKLLNHGNMVYVKEVKA